MRIENFDNFTPKNKIGISLFEDFQPQGNQFWPTNWKEMPQWKTLQDLGFTDNTSEFAPNAAKTSIWLKNEEHPIDYPGGIVLQVSGYVRDKLARSGYIKSGLNLEQMFNYLIDRWTKDKERYVKKPEHGDLSTEVIAFINKCTKSKWSVNPKTKMIDVKGEVLINQNSPLLKDIKFGDVKGDFRIGSIGIDNLKFAPESVGKNFQCSYNNLKSLEGFPKKLKNDYSVYLYENRIESLEGIPLDYKGSIWVGRNNLKNLIGCPKELHLLDISDNPLESLEGLPDKIHQLMLEDFRIMDWSISKCIEIATSNDGLDSKGNDLMYYKDNKLSWSPGSVRAYNKLKSLILPLCTPESLAEYMKKNPLKIHLLDNHPELKAEVLKLSGLRDVSRLGRGLASGFF
jgi:hypothetical protein